VAGQRRATLRTKLPRASAAAPPRVQTAAGERGRSARTQAATDRARSNGGVGDLTSVGAYVADSVPIYAGDAEDGIDAGERERITMSVLQID